jgi:methionine biosynthesis protein MetW
MRVEEELYSKIWERKESNAKDIHIEKGSRVDVALELLDEGENILDIGCGDGAFGYLAIERYDNVYGVDISETALKIAASRGILTQKINLNNNRLPFESNFFDAVVSLDVIEHVFDPANHISEARRVLKKDGIIVIATPNIRYLPHLFKLVVLGKFPKTSGDDEHYDGGHIHYFTLKDIIDLLKTNKFQIIQKRGVFGREFLREFFSGGIVVKAMKIEIS